MIPIIKHIDGKWFTTEHFYKGRKIQIKSKKMKGMKAHVFYPDNPNKVEFTLRYSFISPKELLKRAIVKIEEKAALKEFNNK